LAFEMCELDPRSESLTISLMEGRKGSEEGKLNCLLPLPSFILCLCVCMCVYVCVCVCVCVCVRGRIFTSLLEISRLLAMVSMAYRCLNENTCFRARFLKQWYVSHCSVVHGLSKKYRREIINCLNKCSYMENLI
jgi:hypothetical protein